MSSSRENPEQIPTRQNEAETRAVISEQGGVEGERKDVDVKDYPQVAEIAQALKDIEFPADKNTIIEYAKSQPQSSEILPVLEKLEDKEYMNVSDVSKAAGLVR
jgi:hypothetical protein